jgi:diguanylate cyclase (GGDEF)-like protein
MGEDRFVSNVPRVTEALIERFNRTVDHCAWLMPSVKPICLFLIDVQQKILTYRNFGLEMVPHLQSGCDWPIVRSYWPEAAVKEWDTEQGKLAIVSLRPDLEDFSEYIRLTYQMTALETSAFDLSRFNGKDMLMHLLHRSDYARRLNIVPKAFVEYMSGVFKKDAALYVYNELAERYDFLLSSNDGGHTDWKSLSFTENDVLHLAGGKWMANIFLGKRDAGADHRCLLFPLYGGQRVFALLLLNMPEAPNDPVVVRHLKEIIDEFSKLMHEIQNYLYSIKIGRRYQQLYTVTKKFHSTMNDRDVLDEVLKTIEGLYGHCDIQLLFTDDSIDWVDGDPEALQAYLNGRVQVHHAENAVHLYAPLAGRQGVYGVIKISTDRRDAFSKDDREFIQLLASTAGHAFENAKLYQQSQRSIADLRLINKMSQQLNAIMRFNDTVDYLIKEIQDHFSVEELGFFTISPNQSPVIYPKCTPFFHTGEGLKLVNRVMEKLIEDQEGLFLGDVHAENWLNIPYRSLIALPLITKDSFLGLIVAVHREPYHFSFDEFRLLQSIVRHSTLAITNARLREELERQVNTDQLTGLFARDYLNKKVELSLKTDLRGVMILIDIDNFKIINDTHGHAVGDEILIHVANIIKQNVRKTDIAARWGGEELAVYLPNCTVEQGRAIAERIVTSVRKSTVPRVTISCGLSFWRQRDFQGGGRDLFLKADQALYRAKEQGKNQLYIYH